MAVMRALAILVLLLTTGACGNILPPVPYTTPDGMHEVLPAERNVPRETAVRPGVEVKVYPSTQAEIDALNCGPGHAAGCTMLLFDLCMIWPLADAPPKAATRIDQHERLGHCNGHTHTVNRTETGIVIDWNRGPQS